ncbi:MAG: patatin-like phospholipase family protein, partial [Candidatus Omnitrophota bacterium]
LRVIEKHFGREKMPFDMIIGTSIGSLVGASYCLGMTVEEIERRALEFNWPNIVDLGFYPTGLIKGDKLESVIRDCVDDKKFENMRIPFALATTDLRTGEELLHTSGDLVKLIRASCSWPGIFNAVEIDGKLLVDGGVRNSIPTKGAYGLGATFVVAVDPGFAIKNSRINNVFEAFIQGVQIMGEELNLYQGRSADLVIKPALQNIDQFGFDKAAEIIAEGVVSAEQSMNRLKRKLFFRGVRTRSK